MGISKRLIATAATALLLSACASSPPSTFYTLASTSSMTAAPVPAAPIFVEMLPVSVSERLARPQIVLRGPGSQLDIREQDRWASPFNFELRDALAAGIVAKSGATDVTKGGRPPNAATYRVAIDLQQFDAIAEEEVRTVFGWTIAKSDGQQSVVCKLAVNESVNRGGVGAVVDGVQRVVGQVSSVIAANVAALEKGQTPVCHPAS
jgi:uncharacterized lipoprotein YmbA